VAEARRPGPGAFEALYRQFAEGLPARVAVMREALDALSVAASVEAATRLYMAAHALRGTAEVYGALALVPHAALLETWSEARRGDGRADPAAVAEARRELDLLAAAVAATRGHLQRAKPR
jgi:chemotaxis protein histidine kinase CheA